MRIGKAVARSRCAAGSDAADWLAEYPSRRSLRALHLALHKTTEALASELTSPSCAAPDWSDAEWAVARAAAAIHGVSPLLADALLWPAPAEWRQFLAEQKAHTATRFARIQQLLQRIDIHAREAGVALVPLKGAALHAIGLYAAGERPMADVDLLVREDQSRRATQILGALGFRETHRSWRHRVLAQSADDVTAALGEHSRNGIKVELHCHIAEVLPQRPVDVSEMVFPHPLHPGLNAYPSKAVLLIHLLLHAAGAMTCRQLRLLQLHDIARLAGRMTDEDWEEVLRLAARTADGGLWWAYPPLTLAARYFGCVPDRVLARAASGCNWLLQRVYRNRTLTDASLSHLWVSAFPGIEWARSTRAMLEYAAARALPSAETVRMRRALTTVQPRVTGGPWAQLSQGQRMLRWVMSRQARYETLQPVRAALRDAP